MYQRVNVALTLRCIRRRHEDDVLEFNYNLLSLLSHYVPSIFRDSETGRSNALGAID